MQGLGPDGRVRELLLGAVSELLDAGVGIDEIHLVVDMAAAVRESRH